MIIIARPFSYYNHVCSHHFSPGEELYYELIENTFEDTCISDLITEGNSVKVSMTECSECDNKYYIIKGMNIYAIMDEDDNIMRGYIEDDEEEETN